MEKNCRNFVLFHHLLKCSTRTIEFNWNLHKKALFNGSVPTDKQSHSNLSLFFYLSFEFESDFCNWISDFSIYAVWDIFFVWLTVLHRSVNENGSQFVSNELCKSVASYVYALRVTYNTNTQWMLPEWTLYKRSKIDIK